MNQNPGGQLLSQSFNKIYTHTRDNERDLQNKKPPIKASRSRNVSVKLQYKNVNQMKNTE